MTAAFRSAQASNNGSGSTTITMTKPSGMSADDVMLASVTARGGTGTPILAPVGALTAKTTAFLTFEALATNGIGFWVASGDVGHLMWSDDDCETWHDVAVSGDFTIFRDVAYGNGTWVAVTNGGKNYRRIWTSTDGKAWTPNANVQYPNFNCVKYLNSQWVAGGTTGLVWVASGDPAGTWTSYTTYGTRDGINDGILCIAYNGTTWLIGTAARTSDGLYQIYKSSSITSQSWSGVSLPGTLVLDQVLGMAWGNGIWVAGGYVDDIGSGAMGTVYTCPNADASGTWTEPTNPWTSTLIIPSDVQFGNNKFVLPGSHLTVGGTPSIWSTADGASFQQLTIGTTFKNGVYACAYTPAPRNFWAFGGEATSGSVSLMKQNPEWTLLDRKNSTTTLGQAMFFKKVEASEPASWSFLLGASSVLASGAIVALSGARPSIPASIQFGGQANASSVSVTAPAVGTWGALTGIDVGLFGTAYGSSFTAPTNYTEPSNSDSASTGTTGATTSQGSYRLLTGVTNIGDIVATAANAAVNIGHRVYMADLNAFSLAITLPELVIEKGSEASTDGDTAITIGSAETVTMSAEGVPTGVTVDFNPTEVTAGESTALTVAVDETAVEGDHDISIVGTAASWKEVKPLKVKKRELPVPVAVEPFRGAL